MWSNMVSSLIEHERVQTTDAKAKELRRIADRTINWSASLGDLLTRDPEKLDAADRARKVHAMRMAQRVVKQADVLRKLFDQVGPRFIGRPGGFTRVLKVGNRHGDAAPVSIVELVDRGEAAAAEEASPDKDEKGAGKGKAKAAPAKTSSAEKPAKAAKKGAKKKDEAQPEE
jgi:large subunit ribosomal protein L17